MTFGDGSGEPRASSRAGRDQPRDLSRSRRVRAASPGDGGTRIRISAGLKPAQTFRLQLQQKRNEANLVPRREREARPAIPAPGRLHAPHPRRDFRTSSLFLFPSPQQQLCRVSPSPGCSMAFIPALQNAAGTRVALPPPKKALSWCRMRPDTQPARLLSVAHFSPFSPHSHLAAAYRRDPAPLPLLQTQTRHCHKPPSPGFPAGPSTPFASQLKNAGPLGGSFTRKQSRLRAGHSGAIRARERAKPSPEPPCRREVARLRSGRDFPAGKAAWGAKEKA